MFNNKKVIRIVALVLVALMLLGTFVAVIEALAEDIPAATESIQTTDENESGDQISAEALPENTDTPETTENTDITQTPENPENLDNTQIAPPEVEPDFVNTVPDLEAGYFYLTDPTKTPRDITALIPHLDIVARPVRVGVYYIYGENNCLAFSHNIKSVQGGLALYSTFGEEYTFYKISDEPVTVMRDFSAKKNSEGLYYHTTSGNTHIIYHCVTKEPVELKAVDAVIENYKSLLGDSTPVFPLYVSGQAYIAVGTYSSKDASLADCENMKSKLGVEFVPRVPNNTSLSVIETESGKILFKIDTADQVLYVRPLQKQESENYIKSAIGNLFDGTFEYKATIDGMYLVNILELEDYIKSVLPYEISSSWHDEALKAFSIVVRSYTLSKLNSNHKNQDFDMCDETHCQAYRGRLRSTDRTDAAVEATKNVVLAYESKICETYYHAISGGVTESCELVWGGKGYPYLVSQSIPDEQYWNYTNGVWQFEVSEKELFEYIQNNSIVKRYVKNPIKSVRVSKYTDTGYAYELEIIDTSGLVSTFTKCDNIRSILTKYAKSARLTIGKSSEITVNDGEKMQVDPYNIIQTDEDGKTVISTSPIGETVKRQMITADGALVDVELPVSDSSTYVISGTGWGHGVGLSQYGAKDMAEKGCAWNDIITYFFPGTYLADLSDLSVDIMAE